MPPAINQPSDEAMLRQLTTQVDGLSRRLDEQSGLLRELTSAVTRLAVIEERQANDRAAMDRAFQEIRETQADIAEVSSRVKTLEIAHPANKATASVVQKVTWLVVAAVIGALLALVLQRPAPAATSVPGGVLPPFIGK